MSVQLLVTRCAASLLVCGQSVSRRAGLSANKLVINKPFDLFQSSRRFFSAMGDSAVQSYPSFRRDESVVEDYHGTFVADPYRWLEDPDSEETQKFVEKQNEITQAFLKDCDVKTKFIDRMTELYNYPKYGCPFRYGSNVFYFFNSGLQAQSVLYVQKSLDSEPHVLLDPNVLSTDGTVSLSNYAFSEDGESMAYGLSSSGSDWQTVHILEFKWGEENDLQKQELEDELKWVKHSCLAWTHDKKGFFYNRFPEPKKADNLDAGTETDINLNQKLFYHRIGSSQSEDVLCWEDSSNPKWMSGAELTDDGKYVLLSISEGCDPVNRLYYCDLDKIGGEASRISPQLWIKLVDDFSAQYSYVANDASAFTFMTNRDAPRYKLVRALLPEPGASASWQDLIGEGEDVMEWARCVRNDLLLVCYTHHVKSLLQVHSLLDGSVVRTLPLEIGSVRSSSGKRHISEVFYSFTGFLSPGTIFRCDLAQEGTSPEVFRETEVKGFDAREFQSKQVFVQSKDGTEVPMFIVSRKGSVQDGSSPALLYGYGGFSISLLPSFSVARILLMRHLSCSVCVANIRGGNEYGEQWHRAGTLERKQNCFDDFASCAEFLVQNGYTSSQKLCIEGGSNGGLLVAACVNQRPSLFGCALAHVGVMDMLRFHRFTAGHNWTSDYGCADNPADFQHLLRYSPLHNVREPWLTSSGKQEQYPAVMVLTGDHDDRVVPLHSLKYIATLQHTLVNSHGGQSPQRNPLLARIETKAGHGAGKPTKKVIEQTADVYSFMAKVLGAEWRD